MKALNSFLYWLTALLVIYMLWPILKWLIVLLFIFLVYIFFKISKAPTVIIDDNKSKQPNEDDVIDVKVRVRDK